MKASLLFLFLCTSICTYNNNISLKHNCWLCSFTDVFLEIYARLILVFFWQAFKQCQTAYERAPKILEEEKNNRKEILQSIFFLQIVKTSFFPDSQSTGNLPEFHCLAPEVRLSKKEALSNDLSSNQLAFLFSLFLSLIRLQPSLRVQAYSSTCILSHPLKF